MADHTLTIDELRSMPQAELFRERSSTRLIVAKMRMGIELKKEKDTAAYKRAKRGLSRMETVLSEKMQKKNFSESSASSASSASSSSKKSPKPLQKPKTSYTLKRP